MKNRLAILITLAALLMILMAQMACLGRCPSKPPHYGAFLKKDCSFIEMEQKGLRKPLPSDEGVPRTSDKQPLIVVWDPDVIPRFLGLYDREGNEVRCDMTPKEDGVLELRPREPLSPGMYCLVAGHPLLPPGDIPHWYFVVEGTAAEAEATRKAVSATGVAQGKTSFWNRLDVDITVLPNSDMRIIETQELVFIGGPFRRMYRSIPTDRLEAITDVEVWEGDRQYSPGHESEYTYATSQEGDIFRIIAWYPNTSDATRTFTLKYTVKGGLRFYGGDEQIRWEAVFPNRDVAVRSSTVTIHLPADYSANELKITYDGAPAETRIVDPRTVIFEGHDIAPGEKLEVVVQFPAISTKATASAVATRQAALTIYDPPKPGLYAVSRLTCLEGYTWGAPHALNIGNLWHKSIW